MRKQKGVSESEVKIVDALRREESYTINDIYALPDGERAELIDGKIYYMSPPTRRHQDIIFSLSRKIADYIDSNNGNCKVYLAPFAVFLGESNRNYVEPDISVVCEQNKLTDAGCNGAPEWVIEVVSPGSRSMDYFTKLFKYRTAGVKEYWIVDYTKNLIMVYRFEKDTLEQYDFGEDVSVGIFDGFSVKVE